MRRLPTGSLSSAPKPVSYVAAAVIVLVWLVLAWLLWLGHARMLART